MSDIEQYSPVKPKLVKVNSTSGKYKNDVGHNTSANPTSRKYLSANYDQSSSNGKLSKFKSVLHIDELIFNSNHCIFKSKVNSAANPVDFVGISGTYGNIKRHGVIF